MKSIRELTGNIVDYKLVESFQFTEGTFTFSELRELVGKKSFAEFLLQYLQDNGVKIEYTIKNGIEVLKPIKLSNNMIMKFWVSQDGELQDVSVFQPKSLF